MVFVIGSLSSFSPPGNRVGFFVLLEFLHVQYSDPARPEHGPEASSSLYCSVHCTLVKGLK